MYVIRIQQKRGCWIVLIYCVFEGATHGIIFTENTKTFNLLKGVPIDSWFNRYVYAIMDVVIANGTDDIHLGSYQPVT